MTVLFVFVLMFVPVGVVAILVALPNWPWLERTQAVPNQVLLVLGLFALGGDSPFPSILATPMVLIAIGLALRPLTRSLVGLEAL